jgi:hypothetical protein
MSLAIDVGIGLAFVFALVALMCTGLQELLAAMLNLRGKTLWEGVASMLQANDPANARAAANITPGTVHSSPGMLLEEAMRLHPLIVAVVPDRFGLFGFFGWLFGTRKPSADIGSSKPSYLQASTFATVLADQIGALWKGGSQRYNDFPLAIAAMPEGPLKKVLQGFVLETQGDPLKLRAAIEAWFDGTMERVGGWYKRRVQVLLLLIGLVVAGVLNIDAVHIANALWTQPALRSALADRATAASTKVDDPTAAATAAARELGELHLPMGWTPDRQTMSGSEIALMLAGWLITALAASFGAPFWFDLVGKLVPLRSSGAKPAALPEQPVSQRPAAHVSSALSATSSAGSLPSEPFRAALNDYEARSLSAADIVELKRTLGLTGDGARSPMLDQAARDAIRRQQTAMNWPATGELSARWVQALRTGNAAQESSPAGT